MCGAEGRAGAGQGGAALAVQVRPSIGPRMQIMFDGSTYFTWSTCSDKSTSND